jgi:hypothetical protein
MRLVVLDELERPVESEQLANLTLRPRCVQAEERVRVQRGDLGEPGPELPVELLARVLVVGDAIHVRDREVRLLEAVTEGRLRQPRIVLDARESLLLRRGDQLAVVQEAAGGVVEMGRDADDRERHEFGW